MRKIVGAVAVAMAAVSAVGTTGCSGDKPAAAKCEQVSAPMTDIPTRTDQEPRMRVPQPQGWERTTKLDGILRSHQLLPDGSRRDTAVYSILDIEWPAVRTNLKFRLSRHSD